jgi:hypothetical protein
LKSSNNIQNVKGLSLRALSFPDARVLSMAISDREKVCQVGLDGAYLKSDGGRELPEGDLKISGWRERISRSWDPENKNWSRVFGEKAATLKDICEALFESDVVLKGFATPSGLWTEHTFIMPENVEYTYHL